LSSLYVNVKVKGQDTYYSAAYKGQTQEQQHFTISEVEADWHIMWSSVAYANGQLDPRCSQQTYHCPNQPH